MKSLRNQQGLAAVELTLLTPFIMLLIYIALDFGRVMNEVIVANSAANAGAGHASLHSTNFDEDIDSAGILAIVNKDVSELTIYESEDSAVTVESERVCRCFDPDATSLSEPTVAACSVTCDHNKEVYIQASISRDFKTLGGHDEIPTLTELNRHARFRVE